MALARLSSVDIKTAHQVVDLFLEDLSIDLAQATREIGDLANLAFERFGKGRHKAALSFGDRFAYACARHLSLLLLYKGDDFALTDLALPGPTA